MSFHSQSDLNIRIESWNDEVNNEITSTQQLQHFSSTAETTSPKLSSRRPLHPVSAIAQNRKSGSNNGVEEPWQKQRYTRKASSRKGKCNTVIETKDVAQEPLIPMSAKLEASEGSFSYSQKDITTAHRIHCWLDHIPKYRAPKRRQTSSPQDRSASLLHSLPKLHSISKVAFLEQCPAKSSRRSPVSLQRPFQKRYNTRKRIAARSQAPPTPIGQHQKSDKRRALVATSGNPMPLQGSEGTCIKGREYLPDSQTKLSSTVGRGRQDEDEDSSLMKPDEIPASIIESPLYLPAQVGSTTTPSSTARSQSPTKGFSDWNWAEWPVHRKVLDGHTAEMAGGFLTKYKALRTASEGDSVIPKSLKVGKPFTGDVVRFALVLTDQVGVYQTGRPQA